MKLRSGILKKGSYGAYTPSEPSSSRSTPIQPSTGQETPVFGLGGAKPPPRSRVPKILTQETGKTFPRVQLHDICLRVITLAQTLSGHKFYPYQVKVAYRAVQSILLRDGATITSLLSRQSGKSDVVACTIAALAVLLPYLSKIFYWDWRFNLTDEEGRYRGFAHGLLVGIYAPKADQAVIIFNRVKQYLETPSAKRVFSELKISFDTFNGETCRLSNGSRIMCQTASDTSKNEGETHHILVLEESQDIGELKIRKSLYPMVSSTKGTIWMIGTSSTKKCVFYEEIRANEREQMNGGQMNHFFFPHQIVEQYNSLYRDFVKLMKVKLGEFSDEFRMAFRCLSGSTDVILANGEVKQLKDMRVGDYVISHTGAHRRVQKVKNMGVKDTLRLSFYGAPDVISTPDHRFLTTDGWVQAQDLTKKHRLLVPRIQSPTEKVKVIRVPFYAGRKRSHANTIPHTLPLTPELGEFFGWYVAEGYSAASNKSTVELTLSRDEVAASSRIRKLFKVCFGLTAKTQDVGPCKHTAVNSTDLNQFLRELFGHGAENKKLPSFFFKAPEEFIKAFVRAYWEGDGCYPRWTAASVTASLRLHQQLDYLLRTHGILPSIYTQKKKPGVIQGRPIPATIAHSLYVYGTRDADVFNRKTTKRQQVYLDQGYMLRRLKGIAQAGKEEVWDIEVAHDHSFCTRSVVAHNCEWIFERGMFVTQDALLHQQVAAQSGEPWSELLIPEEVGRLFGPGYKFVAGIDWGRDNDSTVVAVSAVDWNNPVLTLASNQVAGMASVCLYRRHLVSLMEWRGDNYEVQFAEINAYLSRFGPRLRRVVTDANTVGKAIFDRLTAVYDGTGVEIMPCTFSAKAKSDLYKAFYAELCGHRLTFPYSQKARAHRCVRKFVDEMLDLRKDYNGGIMKVAHPNAKGAHDDYPDAVALSCWGTLIEQDSYELDCASSNPFYLP